MDAVFCKNGHSYNPREHATCPFCGVSVDLGETTPYLGGSAVESNDAVSDRGKTRAALGRADAQGATIGVWRQRLGGIDPVVGWLVCVQGPDRGRDYRIHGERNAIGRAPTMDIPITGDAAISRERHAVLSYDPRRQTFRLAPGESRGIVYLNGEEVVAATELQPYDSIELGETKLLFVPFCGERFVWSVDREQGKAQ